MIVSASRRTDLPAFHADWLCRRFSEGYALVRNPFRFHQVQRVPLTPETVDGLVFWTKDPLPLAGRLGLFRPYPFYIQWTLTPYGRDIEPGLPAKPRLIAAFRELGGRLGPLRLVWRYDPVLLSPVWTLEKHKEAFARMAAALAGASDTCVVSVARAPDDRATLESADSDDEEDSTDESSSITAYLRVGESQIIYQISGDDFTAMMDAGYDTLRHQQIFWGDFADVNQIDITLEGESHTITSSGDGDDRVYSYNDSEVDLTDVTTALENLTADSFTDEAATGQEEISLTLHLDNEDFPTVTIRITRYDGELCLAEVDGSSVALVSRSDAMDLVEAVQAIVLGQST